MRETSASRIGFSAPPDGSGGLGGQAIADCKNVEGGVNTYFTY